METNHRAGGAAMTDTPETDAVIRKCQHLSINWLVSELTELARKLELRLAQYADDKSRLAEMIINAKSERNEARTLKPE